MVSRAKDLTGQKFGRLIVISRLPNKIINARQTALWRALCDCGNEVVLTAARLTSSNTKSCGCLHRDKARERGFASKGRPKKALRKTNIALKTVMHTYKKNARNRGLSFDLDKESFYFLLQQTCFYCGASPSAKQKIQRIDSEDILLYNGVDRIDSSLGYSKENCVSCCRDCNFMKQRLSLSAFIAKCRTIVKRFPEKEVGA